MYLSVTMISVVMIYAGYKTITHVVALHIVQSAVVDSEVVRGVKGPRCSSAKYNFIGHLGGDGMIISYGTRI